MAIPYTTLKRLRGYGACAGRYAHLKKALGKGYGDDTPIRLVKILETNGLDDVLWIPESAVTGSNLERRYRLFAVACCFDVWHLMIDQRSRAAVVAAHLYAHGEIDAAARAAARAAAWSAAWDAARAAAWSAARAAARAAADAAWSDAMAAARDAARDAAWAAARAAAWAAARDAARDAAWAAARDDAGGRQSEHFRIIFGAAY